MIGGVIARSRRACGSEAPERRSLVVKAIGGRRSGRALRDLAAYIGRNAPSWERQGVAALPIFDEMGNEVPDEALSDHLRSWNLDPDSRNLSKKAREVAEQEGLAAVSGWPEKERLRHVQVHHFVVSLNATDQEADDLWWASRDAIQELFFMRTHRRVLWAMHLDHPGRPHVHVIIKSQAEEPEEGRLRRWRWDRFGEMFDEVRAVWAVELRRQGLHVEASRREDRAGLREDILAGEADLRPGFSRACTRPDAVRASGGSRRHELMDDVPQWWQAFGLDWLRRKDAERTLRRKAASQAKNSGMSYVEALRERLPKRPKALRLKRTVRPEGQELLAAVRDLFTHPEAAVESYLTMAAEGAERDPVSGAVHLPAKATADWYLLNRPSVFGDVTRHAALERRGRGINIVAPDADRLRPILARVRPAVVSHPRRGRMEEMVEALHRDRVAQTQGRRRRDALRIARSLDRLGRQTAEMFEGGVGNLPHGRSVTILALARQAREMAGERGPPASRPREPTIIPVPRRPGPVPGRDLGS